MAVDVKMPNVGESVQEGVIHKWRVKSGDFVNRDDVLVELETDKATVEVVAESAGAIEIIKKQGETVAIGEVMARIDNAAAAPAGGAAKAAAPAPVAVAPPPPTTHAAPSDASLSPAVRRMTEEHHINPASVAGTGKDGRITKGDVIGHMEGGAKPAAATLAAPAPVKPQVAAGSRAERREPMTMLRRRIAERLVHAQETAAILTTFNEIDMSGVMKLRSDYKDKFKEKYGINLGFMSFFIKAAVESLKAFPAVNGWIDGTDIVYHDYYDIGVAVSSNRGLVVPVIKNADMLSPAELEMAVSDYGKRARDGKLTVDE
ncbi:MAG: 2-oxo acid dehydrogenase subunit E2, partial [Pseudomonadota bacterium]